jgi:hypothetical protein
LPDYLDASWPGVKRKRQMQSPPPVSRAKGL